jgi:hypothetical protein
MREDRDDDRLYARCAVYWDWKVGEEFIGQAELLVVGTQGDRDLWKRGVDLRLADWTRDHDDVAAAYAARDKIRLYVALMGAMADLPGLRALGRAVLFLRWRVVKAQPQRRLLREAASFGISETTLERAKRRLRMESIRKGGIAGAGRWYVRRAPQPEEQPPVKSPNRGQLRLPLDR